MAAAGGVGEKLPLSRTNHAQRHAIERGLCGNRTEFHAVGRRQNLAHAEPSNGLRIDAGYREGDAVSPHYDAMLPR